MFLTLYPENVTFIDIPLTGFKDEKHIIISYILICNINYEMMICNDITRGDDLKSCHDNFPPILSPSCGGWL